jgi:hypothetical protein
MSEEKQRPQKRGSRRLLRDDNETRIAEALERQNDLMLMQLKLLAALAKVTNGQYDKMMRELGEYEEKDKIITKSGLEKL